MNVKKKTKIIEFFRRHFILEHIYKKINCRFSRFFYGFIIRFC